MRSSKGFKGASAQATAKLVPRLPGRAPSAPACASNGGATHQQALEVAGPQDDGHARDVKSLQAPAHVVVAVHRDQDKVTCERVGMERERAAGRIGAKAAGQRPLHQKDRAGEGGSRVAAAAAAPEPPTS